MILLESRPGRDSGERPCPRGLHPPVVVETQSTAGARRMIAWSKATEPRSSWPRARPFSTESTGHFATCSGGCGPLVVTFCLGESPSTVWQARPMAPSPLSADSRPSMASCGRDAGHLSAFRHRRDRRRPEAAGQRRRHARWPFRVERPRQVAAQPPEAPESDGESYFRLGVVGEMGVVERGSNVNPAPRRGRPANDPARPQFGGLHEPQEIPGVTVRSARRLSFASSSSAYSRTVSSIRNRG
jgi:hypothetical protein